MSRKKWADPLDKLLSADNKISSINEYLSSTSSDTVVHSIPSSKILRWEGKDRPENELGNLDALAHSMKTVGQQVPCIVRPKNDHYELIVGECRWRAAIIANINLKAIICEIDDRTASIIQAVENEQRNDLSDYAKGMSYYRKIQRGILTQKDLIEVLNISKEQVTKLLSFSKIPKNVNEAIKDFRKVSARTSYEISRLSRKSMEHQEAIIYYADKIREGKLGSSSIIKLVDKRLSEGNYYKKQFYSKSGDILFTYKNENKQKSLHFSSKIINKLNDEMIERITKEVLECLDN
ncbi:hypothetical protein fh0823_28040 (plasmid) [Francisella halioticida]|uniref:ParB/RepB/Spo0J family partition protein n=1 Tax=Francisella halioticida TaxID=549298 RepID=UPI001AFAB8CC|nr:ParB/RepB/Spo0J family partition protein [Francisella halioticida]BCD92667.1 hypothetical protein fh0823_28040 [Francisella halioticida]